MIDVDNGIADVQAGSLCFGHDERNSNGGIARVPTCLNSFRSCESNRMTEAPLKEWETGALVAFGKVVYAVPRTHVKMCEREECHEREERVLETGGSLRHKKGWLHGSSQPLSLQRIS